jgi:putative ABC transport system permease protein
VSLSVLLLIAAGLMLRSLFELQRAPMGVRTQHLLTAGISLPDNRYGSRASISRFYRTLLDNLQTLPGVRSAGLVSVLPITGYWQDNTFNIEGRPLPPGKFIFALDRVATPEYFRIAGIPVLAGRLFRDGEGRGFDDDHPRQSAVVVSQSMARKFWPQGDALGQRIYFGDANSPRYEVVGIVGDVLIHLDDRPLPTMYTPALEGRHTDLYAVLDAAGDPLTLASAVRSAVSRIDPDIPAFKIRNMQQIVAEASGQRAFTAALLGCFAALALLLSAVGLYGVLSYLIAQRRAEMGIRMALGAGRGKVCWLVLRQGMAPACIGLLVGLSGAAAVSRTMNSVLFGIQAHDAITFLLVPAVLILVAIAACLVPAWRAACVDPMDALRSE